MFMRLLGMMALTIALGLPQAAQAQAPTTAQRNALRQNCSSDYQAMCSSIPPGGRASLQCLSQNMPSLSPACQSAVRAVSGGGGGGGGMSSPAPVAARPVQACREDFMQFCNGVRPGGGRAMICLREHAMELSSSCQSSLQAMRR